MTIVRTDGAAVRVEIGSPLSQGDLIETGADGRVGITFDDGSAFNLSSGARIALAEFDYDSDNALSSALVRVSQGSFAFVAGKAAARGGFSIDTPFATIRSSARGGAIGTLTLAAFTIALLQELDAAINDPFLLDDLINYKDLLHGTLLIAPKGGDTKGIVLDDPEVTIVVGPPETGYIVEQLLNSPAQMAILLAASEDANTTYTLGQADPLITGSLPTGGGSTGSTFPGLPGTQTASTSGSGGLPPLPPGPNTGNTGSSSSNPPPPPILDTDVAVTFAITVASEDPVNPVADASATIVEQVADDDTATFTIALSGDALSDGNTASVTLTMSGDAENADFTAAVIAAVAAAATAAGIAVSGLTATSLVLTWDENSDLDFDVDLTAFNDDLLDSGDALTLTLSAAAIDEGTAGITTPSATATILDNDVAVTFAVTVDDEGAESSGQAVSISEENGGDNAATFTVSMSPALSVGNSASVVLSFPSTATDGTDYSPAIETAIADAIAALAPGHGISYVAATNTLTFTGGGLSSLSFVVTASNDDALDSPETIVVSLGTPTIVEGEAAVSGTQGTATATITDIDVAVNFAITVASEATGNDTPNGLAVIAEELTADDTGTFTITKGGGALTGGNTASVVITVSGTGEDGDFTLADGTPADYSAIVAAVAAAANTALGAGSAVIADDTVTVTWGAGDPASFSVNLTAFNDALTDSPENIVLTLSSPTVAEGSASLVAGDESATLNITDTDVAPVANGETIYVNSDPVDIPEWVLLLNDTDGAIDVTNVSAGSGGAATHTASGAGTGSVNWNDDSTPGGSFTYQAVNSGGVTSGTATVTIVFVDGATINGDAGNNILIGGTGVDILNGGGGDDVLIGDNGGDTLTGGEGNDRLVGGSASDTYQFGLTDGIDTVSDSGNAAQDKIVFTAPGAETPSTLNFERVGNNLVISYNGQQITVTDQFAGTGAEIDFISFAGGATFAGYSLGSADYEIELDLSGGPQSEIIAGTSAGETLSGGNDNDLLFGNDGDDKLNGGADADLLVGGAGNDTLQGGIGTDILVGGTNVDQFRLQTNGGLDTIIDYTPGTDKIGFLEGSGGAPAVNFATAGTTAGATLTAGDGDFTTRGSIAAIDDGDDNQVVVITATQTAGEIAADAGNNIQNLYVVVFNSTTGKAEIWFDTDWGETTTGRVQVATLDGVTAAQVAALTASDFVVYNSTVDPLILDLGAPGLDFTSVENGVTFDIDGDGVADQVAWTAGEDGILALDLDGSGTIDDGTEIFSPDFAGGSHANSLAALATLDSNGDAILDASDERFSELLAWTDTNHDGISDEGELHSLLELGIESINLDALLADTEIDGQHVFAQGQFTLNTGETRDYIGVNFSVGTTQTALAEIENPQPVI